MKKILLLLLISAMILTQCKWLLHGADTINNDKNF